MPSIPSGSDLPCRCRGNVRLKPVCPACGGRGPKKDPDELELVAWYLQLPREDVAKLRDMNPRGFRSFPVACARVRWEREGKPALPIVDPRSLA